jgi:hypothetical protein
VIPRHFAAVNASVERFLSSDDVPMFAKRELLVFLSDCAAIRPRLVGFDPDAGAMAAHIVITVDEILGHVEPMRTMAITGRRFLESVASEVENMSGFYRSAAFLFNGDEYKYGKQEAQNRLHANRLRFTP